MKILYFLAFLLCIEAGKVLGQNTISFTYNESGALTQRKLQVTQGGRLNYSSSADSSIFKDFKVYPNPASTYLTIEGQIPENVKEGKIRLLNSSGQLLKTDIYTGDQKTISVADLTNGIYFLEIWFSKKDRKDYKIIVVN